ncbi:MAG: hypothetical protein ACFB3T_02330 [Geminicoccaceae bacterium]
MTSPPPPERPSAATPSRQAVGPVDQLLALTDHPAKTSDALRASRSLAFLLDSRDALAWIDAELHGYERSAALPAYRSLDQPERAGIPHLRDPARHAAHTRICEAVLQRLRDWALRLAAVGVSGSPTGFSALERRLAAEVEPPGRLTSLSMVKITTEAQAATLGAAITSLLERLPALALPEQERLDIENHLRVALGERDDAEQISTLGRFALDQAIVGLERQALPADLAARLQALKRHLPARTDG